MKKNCIQIAIVILLEQIFFDTLSPLIALFACISIQLADEKTDIRLFLSAGLLEDSLQITFRLGTYALAFVFCFMIIAKLRAIVIIPNLLLSCITLFVLGCASIYFPSVICFGSVNETTMSGAVYVAGCSIFVLTPYLIMRDLLCRNSG